MSENEHDEKVEWRLQQLESAVKDISSIKEIVIKWDSKFEGIKLTEIPLLSKEVESNKKQIEGLEKDVEKLTKFLYSGLGALGAIEFAVNVWIYLHSK